MNFLLKYVPVFFFCSKFLRAPLIISEESCALNGTAAAAAASRRGGARVFFSLSLAAQTHFPWLCKGYRRTAFIFRLWRETKHCSLLQACSCSSGIWVCFSPCKVQTWPQPLTVVSCVSYCISGPLPAPVEMIRSLRKSDFKKQGAKLSQCCRPVLFHTWHGCSPLCFPNLVTGTEICTTEQAWHWGSLPGGWGLWRSEKNIPLHQQLPSASPWQCLKEHGALSRAGCLKHECLLLQNPSNMLTSSWIGAA